MKRIIKRYLKTSNQNLDSKLDLCTTIESVLDGSIQCKEKPAKNQKYDMSVTIIDYILSNETILNKDLKLSEFIGSKVNSTYFDQLVKAFAINPINSLKTAKFLIKALRNVNYLNY